MAYRQIPSTLTLRGTNQPQPMLGSWISAIVTGSLTGVQTNAVTLTLGNALSAGNDADIFVKNEWAWLINVDGTNPEPVFIQSKSGNNITLGPMTDSTISGGQFADNPVIRKSHAAGAIGTGTWIMPKINANNFLVTFEDGGTGNFMYVGCKPNMTATAFRVFKMAKAAANAQPAYYSSAMFSPGNPFDIAEMFMFGTLGDIWNLSVAID